MELRYYIKYYYTENSEHGQIVNSEKVLQFKDTDGDWKDVPIFDDTAERDKKEREKNPKITK